MSIQHSSPQTSTATMAAIFCFSTGPIGFAVQKYLTSSFTPATIIAMQMSIGATILWCTLPLFPRQTISFVERLKPFAVGIIHPASFMIIFTAASRWLDSVTAILLSAFMPAVLAVLARIVLKETLKPSLLLGMGISFAGLLLVISERHVTGESNLVGYLLATFALSLAAAGQIIGRAIHTRSNTPWQIVATMQVTGAAVTAWMIVIVSGQTFHVQDIATHWIAIAYIGVIVSGMGYLTYNFALSKMPILRLGLLSSIGPASGAISASIIFNSPFGIKSAIGVAVIVFGTALPSLFKLYKQTPPQRS